MTITGFLDETPFQATTAAAFEVRGDARAEARRIWELETAAAQTDLDFDAARAEWERQGDQSAAYANYLAGEDEAPEVAEPDYPVLLRAEGEWW